MKIKHKKICEKSLRSKKWGDGVALIISMILLVVLTLLGLAAVRVVSTEERMVAQSFDRTLSMQAAESALREAELQVETSGKPTVAAGAACSSAGTPAITVCGAPLADSTPRWISATFADSNWNTAVSISSGSISITPQYLFEYLGDSFPCGSDPSSPAACKRYRITSRARPGPGRSEVMLQSIYATS
jgi:type IV pilus assembly protein PilX